MLEEFREERVLKQSLVPHKTKKWLSNNTHCDICQLDFKDIERFVDAPTKAGPWALMCPACYIAHGSCLSSGQVYDAETKCKLVKPSGL